MTAIWMNVFNFTVTLILLIIVCARSIVSVCEQSDVTLFTFTFRNQTWFWLWTG